MKKILTYVFIAASSAVIIALAVLVPPLLAGYNDGKVLDRVDTEPAAGLAGGFRYSLTPAERVYILSMALQNRVLPQSDYARMIRGKPASEPSVSYAYTVNSRGPSPGELSYEDAVRACGAALSELRAAGAIPECRFEPEKDVYDIELYTAVDMLEPQKNISVWQITYGPLKPASAYQGALLEAWVDAETGKLYAFSFRSHEDMDDFDPGVLMDAWLAHAELGGAQPLADVNPLLETTPHYQKYTVGDNEQVVVTAGYYEGINEVFLRIT